MNSYLKNNILSAENGLRRYRRILKKIKKIYITENIWKNNQLLKQKRIIKYKDVTIIFFPSTDREVNYHGIKYLPEYIKRNDLKFVVIIFVDEIVNALLQEFDIQADYKEHISFQEANDLLMLDRLIEFDRRLVIISLSQPLGRKGEYLKKYGISTEKLVAIGMYHLIPFRSVD